MQLHGMFVSGPVIVMDGTPLIMTCIVVHELKYFTNPFLLETLLFVMHFLLVVITALYLSHLGGSNKFEKAVYTEAMLDREVQQKMTRITLCIGA